MPRPKLQRQPAQFGPKLAGLRRAAGLTQQQLSDKTGISRRMVAHYETQVAAPPGHVLTKIAQALAISTDELLGLRRGPVKPQDAPQSTVDMRLWRKLQQLQKLSPRKRQAVLQVLEDFLAANVNGNSD